MSLIARDTRPMPPAARREDAIEGARLVRGSKLTVKRLTTTQYIVIGSKGTLYPVDLDVTPVCYCKDSEMRGGLCKHGHAAALASGNMTFINRLAATYEAAVRAEREAAEARAGRRAKRRTRVTVTP